MTDELTIQQRRPSAMPYVLGGAAVGGLGGYYGLPKVASDLVTTPGKYESFEALVKEASDNDKFVKAIAEAKDHEKPLMEKMKGVGDKIKNAEAEWQKGLDKALKEKNLDTAIYETAMIVAMMPGSSAAVLIVRNYGGDHDFAGGAIVISTIVSLATIPAMLYVLL